MIRSVFMFLFVATFMPITAGAASPALFMSPASGTVSVGETFFVDIVTNTQGQDVNAIAAYIEYPEALVYPVSLDTSGSPFAFIIEQNYGLGRIEISGGRPNPGFNGEYTIATVEFKAINKGTAELIFLPTSAVVTNKGNQDILIAGQEAVYEITAGAIKQEPQPASSSQGGKQPPDPVYVQEEPVYMYEEPMKTFITKSSFFDSVSAVASFFGFLSGLVK